MKCCIMLSSKHSLNCCTCLIYYEIETWFEFELKTLEKINRKGITNSLKMEKPNSVQLAQAAPPPPRARARAPARANRRLPHVSLFCLRALSPLSLPLPGGPVLSALFPSHTRTFSLACPQTPPVRPPVPNLSPTHPRRGRAHDRVISSHLRTPLPH
jgi:hypothetical protein